MASGKYPFIFSKTFRDFCIFVAIEVPELDKEHVFVAITARVLSTEIAVNINNKTEFAGKFKLKICMPNFKLCTKLSH